MSEKKLQRIWCTDEEKQQLVKYLKEEIRGETSVSSDTSVSTVISASSQSDIMSKLDQILEKIDYQPLDSNWQLILRQALFLWQFETNERADPVNKGTPQGYPVDYFIDLCKKNQPQWLPDEEAIANFVNQLRVKT